MDPEPTLLLIFLTQSFSYWLITAVVTLLLLLIFSALISGAEVAYFSLSQTDLNKAEASKSSYQQIVVELLQNPKKLLATILISNNFINILIVLLFAFIGEVIFKNITPNQ